MSYYNTVDSFQLHLLVPKIVLQLGIQHKTVHNAGSSTTDNLFSRLLQYLALTPLFLSKHFRILY